MVHVECGPINTQDFQAENSIKVTPTEVWSLCSECGRWIVGVTVKDQPDHYTMECKHCGHSAIAFWNYNAAMEAYGC